MKECMNHLTFSHTKKLSSSLWMTILSVPFHMFLSGLLLVGPQTIFADIHINEAMPLSVWLHTDVQDYEFQVINEAATSFNNSQDQYHVKLIPSPFRVLTQKTFATAPTGELPCILEIDAPYVATFAWPGYLMPLDKFISPALLDDLLPSIIEQGTFNNQLYALGQFDSGLGLWANKRYLEAAGVRIPSLTSPWDLDEFEQALAKLNALKEVEYALSLNLHNKTGEFLTYAVYPILKSFGGDIISPKQPNVAKGVLDSPESVTAMTHIQSWFKKGWSRAEFQKFDDFITAKTALSLTGHWRYNTFKKALGDDLILLPLPDFGHGVKTGMGSWAWAISSTCKNVSGARAFLAHLLSAKEILHMTELNGAVPARYSALSRSTLYQQSGPLSLFHQQLKTKRGVPRPQSPHYHILTKTFSTAVSNIILGADVTTELLQASQKIDNYIAKNDHYFKE
jgi:multiple sugar transport system substrate-binding protein